jgi:hypothetical protein
VEKRLAPRYPIIFFSDSGPFVLRVLSGPFLLTLVVPLNPKVPFPFCHSLPRAYSSAGVQPPYFSFYLSFEQQRLLQRALTASEKVDLGLAYDTPNASVISR